MKKQPLLFSLSCLALGNLIFSNPATAQVTTDGTTNTTINSDNNGNFTIEQGDRAGDNLFHSFGEFSVPTDGSAFFNNAADISNIFNRVTGGNPSNIDGLIGANGTANLFLINPAGILFGNNARLDIGGSFFGTTADSILFEDGEFSATDLDNPPLLTINAPIGLNFRDDPNAITNSSFVQNEAGDDFVGLEVDTGQNLTLVGGDVTFDAGEATAPGGRIEIGGLSEAGTVTIEIDGSLTFPEDVARANVFFSNAADVDVASEGGGNISVNANNIELTGGEFGPSRLAAGILSSSTSADNQAGDIVLNATGAINISQGSNIFNQVVAGGVGNARNITLNTTDLTLLDGSQISAGVFGTGNAGVVTINASGDTTFQGINPNNGVPSGILSNIAPGGSGNAGDIQINTTNLNLIESGTIASDLFGTGNAGNIQINATEAVTVSRSSVFNNGDTETFTSSRISTFVGTDIEGNAGNISIDAGSLTINDGAFINNSTFGQGNAGEVQITTTGAVQLASNSDIFSQVLESGNGNGGEISIISSTLSLTDGSQITAGVFGTGDAGNVIVDVSGNTTFQGIGNEGRSSGIFNNIALGGSGDAGDIQLNTANLNLIDGGTIASDVFGTGNAGSITINANEVVNISGSTVVDESLTRISQVSSSTSTDVVGNAGSIEINSDSLTLASGGFISTSTLGQGNAGLITIDAAGAISADGESSNGTSSGVFSTVESSAVGNSGGINITTGDLTLTQGGVINGSTFGQGNAGLITIDAAGAISADGESSSGFVSTIGSTVGESAVGNSSGINITARDINLTRGGAINGSTFGQGNAGIVNINATGNISADGESSGGFVSAIGSTVGESAVGNSDAVNITTTDLTLTQGGAINGSTFGQGNAGIVNINATGNILADGESSSGTASGVFSTVNELAIGSSGGINITTNDLRLTQGGVVNGSTSGEGNAGIVNINATGNISADGQSSSGFPSTIGSTVGEPALGNSGGINITAKNINLTRGGAINGATFGRGDAGLVTINATGNISAEGESSNGFVSGVFSTVDSSAVGNSSGIDITTGDLTLTQGGVINGSTSGQGNAGAVTINATGNISGDGESSSGFVSGVFSAVNPTGNGNAAGIDIDTNNLVLSNNAGISVSSLGQGNAANLAITSNSLALSDGAFVAASTPIETGGSINLQIADRITLRDNSLISAQAFDNANGGNLTIDTDFIIAFPGNNDIIANAEQGQGGVITINAESLLGIQQRDILRGNTNDINASSQEDSALDGDIFINTSDVNPAQRTTELPNNPIEPGQTVAQACNFEDTGVASSLVVRGRGGIRVEPTAPLSSETITIADESETSKNNITTIATENGNITLARGVIKTADGQIILTPTPVKGSASRMANGSPNCG